MNESNKNIKRNKLQIIKDAYEVGKYDGFINGYLLGLFSGIISSIGLIVYKRKQNTN